MGYKMPVNESKTKVECHMEGADGKVYGIIKEGTKYYIKTTTPGKETIAESYDYIGGFNYRNENGFNDYNKATKILENKIISLNMEHGKHEDVSVVDLNRSEKAFASLTEEARKELDRVKQIMKETYVTKTYAGEAKGDGDPFKEKTDADMEFEGKEEKNPKDANEDYTEVKNPDALLTSDKAPKADGAADKCEKAKCELDGECVANKTKVNENLGSLLDGINDTPADEFQEDVPYEDAEDEDVVDDNLVGVDDDETTVTEPVGDEETEDFDDFDNLMEEFDALICGYDETLAGPHGTLEVQTTETIDGNKSEAKETKEALDGQGKPGKAISSERLNETVESIVREVMEDIKKERENRGKLMETIDRIVREELGIWGKHPKYGEEPFTTPANKEVMKGTADHSIDDESVKGNEQYGKKIGDGKPFDEKVKFITDQVMGVIMESLGLKKK